MLSASDLTRQHVVRADARVRVEKKLGSKTGVSWISAECGAEVAVFVAVEVVFLKDWRNQSGSVFCGECLAATLQRALGARASRKRKRK